VLARLREEPDGDYLDAVIKETLRLRPVVPAVARKLMAPMQFGPWMLPAGVNIAPSIYLLHRRPDLYPDPNTFRPERFLERQPGTYEWIPFGGGVRRCLGASFALMEMKVVLGTILRNVELKPSRAGGEAVSRRAITFAPAKGGRIALAAGA
jgi:cytochrome P450